MSKEKLKFLEFIQSIITRMNANSFQTKAMCIAIISALFAIYATTQNPHIILITFMPLVICCFLDSYYLWQERRFRALYSEVIKKNNKIKDFDLSAFVNYHKGFLSYLNTFLSISIWLFYISIGVCSLILWFEPHFLAVQN